ncbi:MAG: hypothetical protein VYA30_14305 [Myxococcota bacterium]|nr:hypothetical protein [Myxococcota bacterium]
MNRNLSQLGLLMALLFNPLNARSQAKDSERQPCVTALKAAMSAKQKGIAVRAERHIGTIQRLNKKCHRVLKKLAPRASDLATRCHEAAESKYLNSRAAVVIERILTEIKTRQAKCASLVAHLGHKD